MTKPSSSLVLFADLLGFGAWASSPGAAKARDALSHLARLLSGQDQVARLLQSSVWRGKYGLSDSIFLVADDLAAGCAAAAEMFFMLSYVQVDQDDPVFLRGAMAWGEAYQVAPLFPESATANLVGQGVVDAVRMESKLKGPRLQMTDWVAKQICGSTEKLPVCREDTGIWEILWPLGPTADRLNGTMVGEVLGLAARRFLATAGSDSLRPHYLGFLDVALASLGWLCQNAKRQAALAREAVAWKSLRGGLDRELDAGRARKLAAYLGKT